MILTTRTRSYWRVGLAAGLLGLAALAWPRSVHAESLEPVTLQLKWKHQFQFAFGVETSELALWRAQGQPVVALAVIFQHSPQILLARYEANQMQQLIQPVLVELGYMHPGRWQHIAEIYAELGLLPGAMALEGFLYDVPPIAEDLRRLYRILALVLALAALGGLILLNSYRLNRRLRREVQERRTAEAKFRGLVEQSLAGIYIIQNEQFVYVNPKFAEIFGYAPEDMIDRMGPCNLTAEADRERLREILRRCPGERGAIPYTFSAIRQEGALIDVEIHGKPVEYEGRPAIIGVVLDITEQNRIRQQLNYLAF